MRRASHWIREVPRTTCRRKPLEGAVPMSHTAVIVNTAVAIIALVVMIVRFKFNPVVSLVVGSAYLGLAVGLGVDKTIDAIMKGFGDIMAEVGLLIAFGVLMGAILQQTGAIQRLVQTLLKLFGPKR